MSKYDLEELEYDLLKRLISKGLRKSYLSLKKLINVEDIKAVYAINFCNDNPNKEFFLFFEGKIIQASSVQDNEFHLRTYLSKVTSFELIKSNNLREDTSLKLCLEDSSVLEFHSLNDSNRDYNDEYSETLNEIFTYYLLNN